MQIEQGFRLELVASEPDVQSPVALDFDEDGRLFVVEMPGYPLDVSPSGKVKLLEDRDGDGRFDRVSVFADGLVLPTGVMRWKNGVLVTAAPDVLYFEDTDGDGRADVRKVVLTGFARSNPQHTVNSPIYGLDNWVYVAHQGPAGAVIYKELFGDRGKPLMFPDAPDRPAGGSEGQHRPVPAGHVRGRSRSAASRSTDTRSTRTAAISATTTRTTCGMRSSARGTCSETRTCSSRA